MDFFKNQRAEPPQNTENARGEQSAQNPPTPKGGAQSAFESELSRIKTEAALEIALVKAGARDPRTVLPLIERSGISLSGGTLTGLEEQLSALQKTAGYLFSHEGSVRVQSGGSHSGAPELSPQTLAGALGEFYKMR